MAVWVTLLFTVTRRETLNYIFLFWILVSWMSPCSVCYFFDMFPPAPPPDSAFLLLHLFDYTIFQECIFRSNDFWDFQSSHISVVGCAGHRPFFLTACFCLLGFVSADWCIENSWGRSSSTLTLLCSMCYLYHGELSTACLSEVGFVWR